ncbi:MAG TPA: ribonuclease P protein component [Nitrosospira sp.]|nr:ribonuclease P protein component [Nitrosospira sp.]
MGRPLSGLAAPRDGFASEYSLQNNSYSGSRITIRFPKTHRLHNPEEFSSVIRFRCSASSELLQIFVKPNGFLQARLGLIAAGKIERLAVNRNRVKRILREVFRERQQEWAGLDVVMRLRCRVGPNDTFRMMAEAEKLMIQLRRCHE